MYARPSWQGPVSRPLWCQSCGRPNACRKRHFDADLDGRRCESILVCHECDDEYKQRGKRVAATNRTRKVAARQAQRRGHIH